MTDGRPHRACETEIMSFKELKSFQETWSLIFFFHQQALNILFYCSTVEVLRGLAFQSKKNSFEAHRQAFFNNLHHGFSTKLALSEIINDQEEN